MSHAEGCDRSRSRSSDHCFVVTGRICDAKARREVVSIESNRRRQHLQIVSQPGVDCQTRPGSPLVLHEPSKVRICLKLGWNPECLLECNIAAQQEIGERSECVYALALFRRVCSKLAKKNARSCLSGPPMLAPYCAWVRGSLVGESGLRASSRWFRIKP